MTNYVAGKRVDAIAAFRWGLYHKEGSTLAFDSKSFSLDRANHRWTYESNSFIDQNPIEAVMRSPPHFIS